MELEGLTWKVLGKPECLVTLDPTSDIVLSPQISGGLMRGEERRPQQEAEV